MHFSNLRLGLLLLPTLLFCGPVVSAWPATPPPVPTQTVMMDEIVELVRDTGTARAFFDQNPSAASMRQQYEREHREGMAAYLNGRYKEALAHLITADAIASQVAGWGDFK